MVGKGSKRPWELVHPSDGRTLLGQKGACHPNKSKPSMASLLVFAGFTWAPRGSLRTKGGWERAHHGLLGICMAPGIPASLSCREARGVRSRQGHFARCLWHRLSLPVSLPPGCCWQVGWPGSQSSSSPLPLIPGVRKTLDMGLSEQGKCTSGLLWALCPSAF